MFKIAEYSILLFFIYSVFNTSVFGDLQKMLNVSPIESSTSVSVNEIQSSIKEVKGILSEYGTASQALDDISRIDYVIGDNTISFNQLTKYFKLKINRLDTPKTKVQLFASYLFLFASFLSFVISLVLFLVFTIKSIFTKSHVEYFKKSARISLVRIGSFSIVFMFSLMTFLNILNF